MSLDRASALIASRRAGKKPLQDASPDPAALPGIKFQDVPPPACPECHDMGLLIPPGALAIPTQCPCGAYQRHHVERWARRSGLPRRRCNPGGFDSYRVETLEQQAVLDHARAYAEAFDEGSDGLILAGFCGTGKSHLAAAIAYRVIERTFTATWWNVADLFAAINATYKSEDESIDDVLHDALDCNLLVLDDLGAVKSSDHVVDHTTRLLNHRIESNLATIITTNLSKGAIESSLGQRIASRYYEVADEKNRLKLCWKDHRREGENRGEE